MALYSDQNYFYRVSINFGCFTMQLDVETSDNMKDNVQQWDEEYKITGKTINTLKNKQRD